jgi:hypothetical protein
MNDNYVQKALNILYSESPGLDPELAKLYVLLVLTLGTNTMLEDVHDAWSVWRNVTNPAHRSLIPFDGLSAQVRELDQEYADAIHRTARRLAA